MMTEDLVSSGDIFLVALNPTRGSEIRKTMPYIGVSPDELNAQLHTFIVAPLATGRHPYPFRVRCRVDGKDDHETWLIQPRPVHAPDQLQAKGHLFVAPGTRADAQQRTPQRRSEAGGHTESDAVKRLGRG